MEANPSRQWFVYYKEKELGPFPETEVKSKLQSGELDSTTYVYTEGMPDWGLIGETAIFSMGPSVDSGKSEKTEADFTAKPDVKAASEPTIAIEKLSAVDAKSKSPEKESLKAPVEAVKTSGSPKKSFLGGRISVLRLAIAMAALLTGAGLLYTILGGGLPPGLTAVGDFVGALFGSSGNKERGKPIAKDTPQVPTDGTAPVATANQDVDWRFLRTHRSALDPKTAAPFVISPSHYGGARPVLGGALSAAAITALVRTGKLDHVNVAVFPDKERSLMPVPLIWFLRVPLVDGFFVVGPLNIDGDVLPVGRYHLMLASGGTVLGESTFELGTWPEAPKLALMQVDVQKQRSLLVEREKSGLEEKLRRVSSLVDSLRNIGNIAFEGPKGQRKWREGIRGWDEQLGAAQQEQAQMLKGPMFYPDAQYKIFNFIKQLVEARDSLDLVSKGGLKMLKQKKNLGPGQLWAQVGNQLSTLRGEVTSLGMAQNLNNVDPEVVKKRLEAEN